MTKSRREVQERIAEEENAEARYRATFHQAAIGIIHTSPDGTLIEANIAFCSMLGYGRREMLRMHLSDVLSSDAHSALGGAAGQDGYAARQLARNIKLHSRTEQYRHKDGGVIWGHRTVSLASDAAGKAYLIHFIQNVTERKRAEEVQRQSDLRYQRTLESALDCIVTTDHQGRVVEFNPMAERVFGYSRADVLGRKLSEVLVPPRLRKRHEVSMERLLSNDQQSMLNRRIETIALRADGTTIPVELMMQRITDTDPPLFTGFLRDISERKDAEAKILRLNRLYRTLSQTSALIVRTADRHSLFQGICQIAQQHGGFVMPWVGLLDPESRMVRLEAYVDDAALSAVPLAVDANVAAGRGPAATAIREARIVICNDVDAASDVLWRERHHRDGIRSLAALPLMIGGQVIGIFMLRSSVAGYFNHDIAQLLQEMVAELSFALDRLHLEGKHLEALTALRESDERFRQLAENIPQMFWLAEPSLETALYVSPAYETLTGLRTSGAQGRHENWLTCVHEDDRERIVQARRDRTRLGTYNVDYRIRDASGSVRWVNDRAFPIRDNTGKVCRVAGIVSDITEARAAQERLAHLAHYDQLTNLPNRSVFYERLTHGIVQASRNSWTLGVMFIDLDRFKTVNDTMGHSMGDALLRQVAARLLECVRGEDTVSRLSGDEFAIVLARLADVEDAGVVATKILERLKHPFTVQGVEVVASASVGITLYPADADSADLLMRNADVAMYNAKSRGRDNYRFFTAEMNSRALTKMKLESSLRGALEREEFLLHFQPKIRLDCGSICGFEALIRWQPASGPMVAPGDFIPVLEDTGLITAVGEWVVQEACAQISAWRSAGLAPVPIALNLSARQLRHPGFPEAVARMMAKHDVPGCLLEVEITESSLMDNPEEAQKTLAQLKALGVSLAIDDFGTGYSSLSYLKRYPFDTLKIDRSFVHDIPADADDATIARTVIALGHSLGLAVVAEGVETADQLAFLLENGCDHAQGFLFAKPMAAEASTRLLASGSVFTIARLSEYAG